MHGASPALADAAAVFRSRQADHIPQNPQQRRRRVVYFDDLVSPVYFKRQSHGIGS
jgi:hypothetical protein